MRISIEEQGVFVRRLHEIKLISSSKNRYTVHREGQEATRAVDKRSGELNGEYLAKARRTDQDYCGTEQDTVERKFGSLGRVHGIVVSAFGEGSDDLHALISHRARSRVRFLRKSLSVCAVRGQAQVLLGRLDLEVIAPGGAAAAQRRNNALLLEKRWAQQRRADLLSNLLGKSLLRRGHFKLN